MKSPLFIQKAEALLEAGEFIAAQDVLLDGIEKNPTNAEAYYVLGSVLCKLQRFDDAIGVLQKADKLLPKHPRVYHLLGWAIFMQGDIPAGRTFMEVALKADPDNIQLLADLAVVEMRAINLDKARGYIAQARKLVPDDEMIVEIEMMVDKIEKLSDRLKSKPN